MSFLMIMFMIQTPLKNVIQEVKKSSRLLIKGKLIGSCMEPMDRNCYQM